MPHETRGVDRFIVSRLTADATLTSLVGTKVFVNRVPPNTVQPWVLATFLSSPDRNALGPGIRILTRPLYLIRAVTVDTNTNVGDQIADRIDEVLMGASGSVVSQGIFVGKVQREEPVYYNDPPTAAGIIHTNIGGRYRFFVESLGG